MLTGLGPFVGVAKIQVKSGTSEELGGERELRANDSSDFEKVCWEAGGGDMNLHLELGNPGFKGF